MENRFPLTSMPFSWIPIHGKSIPIDGIIDWKSMEIHWISTRVDVKYPLPGRTAFLRFFGDFWLREQAFLRSRVSTSRVECLDAVVSESLPGKYLFTAVVSTLFVIFSVLSDVIRILHRIQLIFILNSFKNSKTRASKNYRSERFILERFGEKSRDLRVCQNCKMLPEILWEHVARSCKKLPRSCQDSCQCF